MTNLELYWVANMINKDEQEEFERKRDELEYLASFINHAAVTKIREFREGKNMVAKISDDDFNSIIKDLSGRDAPIFQER